VAKKAAFAAQPRVQNPIGNPAHLFAGIAGNRIS
jgi:hypothetical protein